MKVRPVRLPHAAEPKSPPRKIVTVTIPEDLDYTTVFDDIFEEYYNY